MGCGFFVGGNLSFGEGFVEGDCLVYWFLLWIFYFFLWNLGGGWLFSLIFLVIVGGLVFVYLFYFVFGLGGVWGGWGGGRGGIFLVVVFLGRMVRCWIRRCGGVLCGGI